MNFLLIGGSGYLGGRLAVWLRQQRHRVLVSGRSNNTTAGTTVNSVVPWPIRKEQLASFGYIDAVVHLASPDQRAAGADPTAFLKTSVELAWQVCELAASLRPVPVMLYLSSAHVYGTWEGTITEQTHPQPLHPYGLGKRLAEEVTLLFRRRNDVPTLCIRLSNVFGAPAKAEITQWNLLFNDLCRQAVTTDTLTLNSAGTQRRNFVTLTDAARAIDFLAARPSDWPADGIIHVGGGMDLSILEAAELVKSRAKVVLEKVVSIKQAASVNGTTSPPFQFSIDRLSALAFKWNNDADREIDETLRLCARHWGSLSPCAGS